MNYLLDTCVLSDFVRGEKNTLSQLQRIAPSQIAISTVTVMELIYGLKLNPSKTTKIKKIITDIIDCVTILPFTQGDAIQAATARAQLKKKGAPIGPFDILIAGTALNNKITLVSANEKEFERIPDLKLLNWRLQAHTT